MALRSYALLDGSYGSMALPKQLDSNLLIAECSGASFTMLMV